MALTLHIAQFATWRRTTSERKETEMLRWSLIFFIISLIAAALGYGGIAADTAEVAKILFFIFLGIFVVTLILGLIAGEKLFGQRR